MSDKPKDMNLYRAGLSCSIGMKALDTGEGVPDYTTRADYALYNLLSAVQDIARHLEERLDK